MFQDRFNSSINFFLNISVSVLSHTLEHLNWWVGSHQLVDSSNSNFWDFSGVLVNLKNITN